MARSTPPFTRTVNWDTHSYRRVGELTSRPWGHGADEATGLVQVEVVHLHLPYLCLWLHCWCYCHRPGLFCQPAAASGSCVGSHHSPALPGSPAVGRPGICRAHYPPATPAHPAAPSPSSTTPMIATASQMGRWWGRVGVVAVSQWLAPRSSRL